MLADKGFSALCCEVVMLIEPEQLVFARCDRLLGAFASKDISPRMKKLCALSYGMTHAHAFRGE